MPLPRSRASETLSSEQLKQVKAPAATLSATAEAGIARRVRVVYGIHSLSVGVAGKTVSEVRVALGQAMNISPRAIALVDGQEVNEGQILLPGQYLEFVRQAGEKGDRRVRKIRGIVLGTGGQGWRMWDGKIFAPAQELAVAMGGEYYPMDEISAKAILEVIRSESVSRSEAIHCARNPLFAIM